MPTFTEYNKDVNAIKELALSHNDHFYDYTLDDKHHDFDYYCKFMLDEVIGLAKLCMKYENKYRLDSDNILEKTYYAFRIEYYGHMYNPQ